MRIHDIISENRVNESGIIAKTVAKAAEPYLAKGAQWAATKLGKTAGQAIPKGASAATQKAAAVSDIAKGIAPGVTQVAKVTGRIATILKFFGLWQMYREYKAAMDRGYAEYAAGRWSEEEYNDYHKNQMGTLVSQIALSTTFFWALKLTSGWSLWVIGLKMSRFAPAVALGTSMATLATATQAGLIQLLNTKEARNTIADLTANTFIDDTLGQGAIDAVQKFKELLGVAEKKAAGGNSKETDTEPTAKNDKDAPAANNSTGSVDSSGIGRDAKGDISIQLDPKFKGISANAPS